MAQELPSTNSPEVMAATLAFYLGMPSSQQPSAPSKNRVKQFIDAYEVIADAMGIQHNVAAARETLERLQGH